MPANKAAAVCANTTFVGTVVYVVIMLSGRCWAQIVVQDYVLMANNMKTMMPSFSKMATSFMECCIECRRQDDCRSVSYNANKALCQLSELHWKVLSTPSTDWKTFARKYECPDARSAFQLQTPSPAYTHFLACPSSSNTARLTWSEAIAACQQFGNLVKINTKQKRTEVRDYLSSIGNTEETFWVDGIKKGNQSCHFHDGTDMHLGNELWTNGGPTAGAGSCVSASRSHNYKLANTACDTALGYICELPTKR